MSIALNLNEDLLYPSGDGKPMSENTVQYRWIVKIKENLEVIFADDPNVFIAADMFWYPIRVSIPPAPRQAPDVMIVFGRPKRDRPSYRQWTEENIPFQVVFEILSESNRTSRGVRQMQEKFDFYERYGVEEYYIYDPDEFILQGWQRRGTRLVEISTVSNWVSPRLGIHFVLEPGQELKIYRPNGQIFLTPMQMEQRYQEERQQAEEERRRAEEERRRAEEERRRYQAERQARLDAVPRLRSLNLTEAQIAEALGLSIDDLS